MIAAFKKRWEITRNWQLIYPFLGIVGAVFSAYLIARGLMSRLSLDNNTLRIGILILLTLIVYYIIILISLWCF